MMNIFLALLEVKINNNSAKYSLFECSKGATQIMLLLTLYVLKTPLRGIAVINL